MNRFTGSVDIFMAYLRSLVTASLIFVFASIFAAPVFSSTTSDTLPPDPGKAGKQTLMGVDSDGDGLRDDIQRYIYLTYPGKTNVQGAFR